ncbi:DegV family protein [Ligilactobacillus equi]|uniref:DegV family protein n=1 Tax=Ligilactobacillus equi DPC 6820 TaxID=1392007 RepID=V7HWX2_9LACO|nr:DegV family protein [Ligilactobacillus equi]ETA74367.1 DegV family protein [Ligilactobacillus equi DPC 6820]
MKIAVVTDSSSYLPAELVEKYQIKVVPIPFILEGQPYTEGVDITTAEFYEKLANSSSLPTTSQPALGQMIELYESLAQEGYDAAITIVLSKTISGFYQSLVNLQDQVEGIKIVPFDSQMTVLPMGYLAVEAAKMAQAGQGIDQIVARLEDLRATINEYFIVDDLQNLVKGGRLSNASAFIGSVLKIKPILTFDNESHEIVAFEKVRSMKKAMRRAEELFEADMAQLDYPVRIMVIHANDEENALKWQAKVQAKYPDCQVDLSYFGPVIGAHLGEKAIALAWMKDVEKA